MPATGPVTIEAAYTYCRKIAQVEAKNFYYAFRVLPRPKSDAMCAVYAFMRKADDISDDESVTVEVRRTQMEQWLASWRASRTGSGAISAGEDPVFVALRHTQQTFQISDALLEDLVRGTSMDLTDAGSAPDGRVDLGGGVQGYKTFDDLYRYCYLVASVVGLVTIRIFGYTDPEAELLAERTGIAFQLTNILRDVKEDAERKRIYLPQDLLHEFAVTNEDVLALATGRAVKPNERAMLAALSVQAWRYYESAGILIPLIDADSRGAMWVLVEIYSGLLRKIDERGGDVFSRRVSVPTRAKILTLLRGAAKSLRTR